MDYLRGVSGDFVLLNGIRRYDSHVTGVDVHNVVTSAIAEVGATYGRKMMTGHIKYSTGLRLGVNRVGQALKRVNPRQHHERQTSITRHLNPVPYYAEYFGHKLHLDQNEKLIRYGVTEVIAVDGYSSFITATSVMPLKNNITIYRDVFRETILRHGLFDQVRVDHGREFYLVLTVQDHLKELRNNTSRQPYIQTQSKQNHAVERLWVEVNCRTNYPIKRALVQMENDGVIDIEDEVTKFCVSWVAKKVVEVGVSYMVNSWNSHPIPGKES
ncbi:unnamed protein product [Porites lobata]|uniref:Integrase core domain-containing protein n=1 Tax=Porites lobata TaxID=104759 RepID=A0ABN8MTI7_9CNID|nr:unnamed protein product [Porites lobata]